MTVAPHTLDEVLSSLEHAQRAHPGFRWQFTRTPCPNGLYVPDFANSVLHVHRYLGAEDTFTAFISAVVEFDANAACQERMAS